MLWRFFALLKMTGAFVCFLDSYLLFFLFGLSNSLRIRGYLIKYPRIFHHVSVDISLRIRGYAKFLLCLRGLLVVCSWVLSYWWLFFCFTQTPQTFADSFFTECFFYTESTGNHRLWCIASLAPPSGMRTLGEAGSCERSNAAFLRILRSLRETQIICVKYIHRTWFFA